jgi:peptidoglycan hydrolase-like protein with peptidoglycan-binding domain
VLQAKAKLPATGVTDVPTWLAVEQSAYPLGRPLLPTGTTAPTIPTTPVTPPVTAPKPVTPPAPTTPSASTLATTTSVSAYKGLTLRQGAKSAAVKALQRALGMHDADGEFGPVTAATVKAFQKAKHLPVTGVVDRRTWDAAELVAHPLLPYRNTVLRLGSTGSAVTVLQKALKVYADGEFGPKTLAAVKAAQKAGKIAATGTVATLTWVTIEKQVYPVGRKRW